MNCSTEKNHEVQDDIVRLDRYQLTNIDEAAFPHYYGFINEIGHWYIMREQSNGDIRYSRAQFSSIGRYDDNWDARTTLQYTFWFTSF